VLLSIYKNHKCKYQGGEEGKYTMANTDDLLTAVFKDAKINKEYRKNLGRIINLGHRIMGYLGPHRMLFLEYEVAVGVSQVKLIENAYNIGYRDGLSAGVSGAAGVNRTAQNTAQNF
jgi:hypothetical protein